MVKEKIQFSVQMTAGEVYKFTMYHMYHGLSGIFGICTSLIAFILLLTSFDSLTEQSKAILILVAMWFVIIDPVILIFRSKSQVKRNKSYQKPLNYQLNQDGITVSQDELEQTMAWDNLMKIVETKTQFLVYSSRVHAFVFPKKAVGESCDAVREMLLQYTEGSNVRLKGMIKKKS